MTAISPIWNRITGTTWASGGNTGCDAGATHGGTPLNNPSRPILINGLIARTREAPLTNKLSP
jgi:hypothetical protein